MNSRHWLALKRKVWHFAISIKLAVFVLTGLTLAMVVATFLESAYDAATAKYYIYKAWWFYALMVLLGVNIFCVAWSRFPWRVKHGPFLLAHVGIFMILVGSWIQAGLGVDGTLVLQEGESLSMVELEGHQLAILDDGDLRWHDVPWRPVTAGFTPMTIPRFPLKIEGYITHAEPKILFEPSGNVKDPSALRLKVEAPWMGISQEFWLWGGDFSQSSIALGAAKFILLPPELPFDTQTTQSEARLEFKFEGETKEVLAYRAVSRSGATRSGRVALKTLSADGPGVAIETGWMAGQSQGKTKSPGGGIRVELLKAIPAAVDRTTYVPSRLQHGEGAPPAAIRVGNDWIGLGDRRRMMLERTYDIAFQPQRIRLPFSIRLEQFKIEHDPGTRQPASYASLVTVIDPSKTFSTWISMNEPLHWGGYIFYQASFVPGEPRPTISVFSVNHDPGRMLKYLGSILIVLGSIWLFAVKSAAWKSS